MKEGGPFFDNWKLKGTWECDRDVVEVMVCSAGEDVAYDLQGVWFRHQ